MKIRILPILKDWPTSLANKYCSELLELEWDYPVLPRIGEEVDLGCFLTDKESNLTDSSYFAKVISITWFKDEDDGSIFPEIIISNDF